MGNEKMLVITKLLFESLQKLGLCGKGLKNSKL